MAEGPITPEELVDVSVSKPEPKITRLPEQNADAIRKDLEKRGLGDVVGLPRPYTVDSYGGINRHTSGGNDALRAQAEYKGRLGGDAPANPLRIGRRAPQK